jgi:hypothetical protein
MGVRQVTADEFAATQELFCAIAVHPAMSRESGGQHRHRTCLNTAAKATVTPLLTLLAI